MVCVTGGNLAWRGTSTRDGGKDDGQLEVFVQGEQELRGGLLHWGSAKNRVDEPFRVGDIFFYTVPSGLSRCNLGV